MPLSCQHCPLLNNHYRQRLIFRFLAGWVATTGFYWKSLHWRFGEFWDCFWEWIKSKFDFLNTGMWRLQWLFIVNAVPCRLILTNTYQLVNCVSCDYLLAIDLSRASKFKLWFKIFWDLKDFWFLIDTEDSVDKMEFWISHIAKSWIQ